MVNTNFADDYNFQLWSSQSNILEKLKVHCKSAHGGRIDLNCNACKELTSEPKKKRKYIRRPKDSKPYRRRQEDT